MKEKKYKRISYNDKYINYTMLMMPSVFIFVIIFFNNYPETGFERFLYSLIIKDRGVYSQIYPFQSQIISNMAMILPPVISLFLYFKSKVSYVSERDIIEEGGIVENNMFKLIFMRIILILVVVLFLFSFFIYVDYTILSEVSIRTTFIRDSFLTVVLLPYVFCFGETLITMLLFSIILNPVDFFTQNIVMPKTYSKNRKIQFLMKKKYHQKISKDNFTDS